MLSTVNGWCLVLRWLALCLGVCLLPALGLAATMANPPGTIYINDVPYVYVGTAFDGTADMWATDASYTTWGDGPSAAQAVMGSVGVWTGSGYEYGLSYVGAVATTVDVPQEDASNWPEGWTLTSNGGGVTNGTNVVVVAPVTNGMWETVISGGVDGSTNIIQINLKMTGLTNLLSLLYAGQRDSSDSVFLDYMGNSVFKDGANNSSWFALENYNFSGKTTFTEDGKLKVDTSIDGLVESLTNAIGTAINGTNAPGWVQGDWVKESTYVQESADWRTWFDGWMENFADRWETFWQYYIRDRNNRSVFKRADGSSWFEPNADEDTSVPSNIPLVSEAEEDQVGEGGHTIQERRGEAQTRSDEMTTAVESVDSSMDALPSTQSTITQTAAGYFGMTDMFNMIPPVERVWLFNINNEPIYLQVGLGMVAQFRTILSIFLACAMIWLIAKLVATLKVD